MEINYRFNDEMQAEYNQIFAECEKEKAETLYFLTGSQIFETMEEISESLAGRVGILDLYGLSEREIENKEADLFIPNIEDIKKRERTEYKSTLDLYKKIYKGAYPELYTTDKEVEQYYSDYFRTFIEKDIRKTINIKDENKFIKFVSAKSDSMYLFCFQQKMYLLYLSH